MQTKILYGLSALVLILSVWLTVSLRQPISHPKQTWKTPISQKQIEKSTSSDSTSGQVNTTVFISSMPTQVKAEIKK